MDKSQRAIALGNFDGIHKGHKKVINPIFSKDLITSLVTFTPHPQEFFTGEKKLLLTPLEEKKKILETMGVDELILVPFNQTLASLSPSEFVEDIIHRKIQAKFISIGEDFSFGYKRQGKAKDLKNLAQKYHMEVNITPEENLWMENEYIRISSSFIRSCLEKGLIPLANEMLGREYELQGEVIQGQKLGQKLGFPTANLAITEEKLLPRYGVYQVKVDVFPDNCLNLLGVMNIGKRPTVKENNITVEIHLLNWEKDLYGKTLVVKLFQFIRPEQKFSSLDDLKRQISLDCQFALQNFQ